MTNDTPRTDVVCPHLNLSHTDIRHMAWELRMFARTLERENAELRQQVAALTAAQPRCNKCDFDSGHCGVGGYCDRCPHKPAAKEPK